MKRLTAIILALAMVFTPMLFQNLSTGVSAATVETYIGDLKVTKVNNIWVDPTVNVMILLTPGQSINALYYTRLIAVYDSASGSYIVTEKVATHCSSTSTVPTNGIGLAFNYAPISGNSYSNQFAKDNWPVWQKIRVGDKLKLSGIDVANKTVSTSGTWASSNFVSNAKISVTTVRDSSTPKTAYSDKTIVCMGDSVTSGGGWTEALSDTFNANFINAGFGGDTSTNYYNYRYQSNVAVHDPDIVIVEFGINDALTYKGTAAGIETYKTTLRNIYNANKNLGAKTIFMTPNNIDVTDYDGSSYSAYGGLQGYLDAFLQGMKDVAAETGSHFIDIYTMWKTNGYVAANYLIDFGHPDSRGYAKNIEFMTNYLTANMNDICDVSGGGTQTGGIVKTEIGNVYLSRVNGLYDTSVSPVNNQCFLVTPGNTLNGLYYDKLYAVYDSSVGGYVVKSKVATHCNYSKTIGTNEIGIAFSYQPASTNGAFARAHWPVWQQIRVGDILKFHNTDIANKKITTSGTWGTNFTSSSYFSVTTVRDTSLPKTSYSDKKIVVLGDSVTAGGGWTEALNIEFNCNMINVATPGDRTDEALNRFDTLVAPHNPDIVFIRFAINDCVQYTITANTLPNFKANLKKLYDKCTALGATVVFMTTNDINISSLNYDRYANYGGLGTYFPKYQQAIRDVAAETSGFCIDTYAGWASVTTTSYLMDTVHPNASGYAIDLGIAKTYLRNNMVAIAGSVGVSAPAVSVANSAAYGSNISVSWGAVTDATSYKYEVTRHMGEKGITDTAVVYSGTTTSTSISIPAQTMGKYLDVKVTAVAANSENSATKTVMIGAPTAYPDDIEYIPLAEVNGSVLTSTSTVWTSSKGTFSALYWAVAVCSPNKDGTYTVIEKYENGQTKSVSTTGNNIIYAVHGSFTHAKYATNIKVGDTIDFCGLYLTSGNTVSDKAYIKVNGGISLAPKELTIKDTTLAFEDDLLKGVTVGAKASDLKTKFNEDASYISVRDVKGTEVTDTVVGTGYTVNLVVDGAVKKSYTIVIKGDVTSDGLVSATDYISVKGVLNNTLTLEGAFEKAGDYDNSGAISSSDYIAIKLDIAAA